MYNQIIKKILKYLGKMPNSCRGAYPYCWMSNGLRYALTTLADSTGGNYVLSLRATVPTQVV